MSVMPATDRQAGFVTMNKASKTIVLVDDEPDILESLSRPLMAEGYRVDCFANCVDALNAITRLPPDLVVLDIMMPGMDGMELLTRLRREQRDLPVIFLTAKTDETDHVLGLQMGADDYIAKPVSSRLLIERIRAVMRRVELASGEREEDSADEPRIVCGALNVDPPRHLCLWRGRQVRLTVTEFEILKALARHPGVVKSREKLLDAAYGSDSFDAVDRTIDSHIKRIRRKFRAVDADFSQIETHYSLGYSYRGARDDA